MTRKVLESKKLLLFITVIIKFNSFFSLSYYYFIRIIQQANYNSYTLHFARNYYHYFYYYITLDLL